MGFSLHREHFRWTHCEFEHCQYEQTKSWTCALQGVVEVGTAEISGQITQCILWKQNGSGTTCNSSAKQWGISIATPCPARSWGPRTGVCMSGGGPISSTARHRKRHFLMLQNPQNGRNWMNQRLTTRWNWEFNNHVEHEIHARTAKLKLRCCMAICANMHSRTTSRKKLNKPTVFCFAASDARQVGRVALILGEHCKSRSINNFVMIAENSKSQQRVPSCVAFAAIKALFLSFSPNCPSWGFFWQYFLVTLLRLISWVSELYELNLLILDVPPWRSLIWFPRINLSWILVQRNKLSLVHMCCRNFQQQHPRFSAFVLLESDAGFVDLWHLGFDFRLSGTRTNWWFSWRLWHCMGSVKCKKANRAMFIAGMTVENWISVSKILFSGTMAAVRPHAVLQKKPCDWKTLVSKSDLRANLDLHCHDLELWLPHRLAVPLGQRETVVEYVHGCSVHRLHEPWVFVSFYQLLCRVFGRRRGVQVFSAHACEHRSTNPNEISLCVRFWDAVFGDHDSVHRLRFVDVLPGQTGVHHENAWDTEGYSLCGDLHSQW